jgi:molecular chaperone DnaK
MSAVAVVEPETGRPVALRLMDGEVTLPSVVFFESAARKVVGRAAREKATAHPELVLETVKNYMGTPTTWDFHSETYTPEMVSAILLRRLKEDVEAVLKEPIEGAVITVPAIFGEAERHATRVAAEIAGLPLLALLEEPVAAAIAYGFSTAAAATEELNSAGLTIPDATVLLYDLGGGTFDLTVMRLTDGGATFKMIATDGDRRLGGKDWDKALVDGLAEDFMTRFGVDPREDPSTLEDLMAKAEEAKRALTRRDRTAIPCQYGGHEMEWELNRSRFDALTADLLEQTATTTRLMLKKLRENGKLPRGGADIDYVLLAGGSSRMPQVARLMRELSGKEPQMLDVDVVVAQGAAVYAAIKAVAGIAVPVTTHDTAPTPRPVPSAAPVVAAPQLSLVGPEHPPVDTTEKGKPAVPRLSLPGAVADRMARSAIQRVCSFSLGLIAIDEAGRSVNAVLVPRNTALPAEHRNIYGTASDNQREILVTVLEGDDEDPDNCILLGEGKITGIPPGLAKGAPVEVIIGLDDESAILVSAVELTHNLRCEFELNRSVALTRDEIARSRLRLSRDVVRG